MHPLRAVFLFFILAAIVAACGRADPPHEPGPRPVKTIVVDEPQTRVTRTFSGMARASGDTPLSFRVHGVLEALPVRVGQRVSPGDLIARLDPGDYELKVRELDALAAQARAGFQKMRADHDRVLALYEVDSVSKSDLDQARAGFESAAAQLEAVSRGLDQARRQLSYTRLYAPMAGSVSAVPVENFQTVQAGLPVAVLSTVQDMEFEVGVPDHLVHQVLLGDAVRVVFDVLPDRIFSAVVSEVGVVPGPMSTFPVKLRIEEPSPKIRPGLMGTAHFDFGRNEESFVLVPPEAVFGLPSEELPAVWVLDLDAQTVHRRQVRVGRLLPDGLQVLDGLEGGEHLVVRGVHRLEEGQKVRLLNVSVPSDSRPSSNGRGMP